MVAFGATFHPGAAPYLLRTPASEMVDRHVDLDAIDPRFAARLDDALSAAPDAPAGVAALAHELARRIDGTDDLPDRAVREAVAVLDRAAVTVAERQPRPTSASGSSSAASSVTSATRPRRCSGSCASSASWASWRSRALSWRARRRVRATPTSRTSRARRAV